MMVGIHYIYILFINVDTANIFVIMYTLLTLSNLLLKVK